MDVLTLAGIARTNAKTVLLIRPSFCPTEWLPGCSFCLLRKGRTWEDGKDKDVPGQSWTRPSRTFYFVGPLLFGICQPGDFVPLWQLNTLAWAKTPGCSQSLLSQLWFHHQPHFQRALLPRSVGGRLWMHSCEAFRQWGKLHAFPH